MDEQISRVLIGTQGFSYDGWEGLIYPTGHRPADRFATYARTFSALEIDRTFYGVPRRTEVERWANQSPQEFLFTAKIPRQITHESRVTGPTVYREIVEFVGSLAPLGDRLQSVLFQFPPTFRTPHDQRAIADLVRALPELIPPTLRVAFEFRNPAWLASADLEAQMRAGRIAWVWNDWLPGTSRSAPMPRAIDAPSNLRDTADFVYVRLNGDHNQKIDYQTAIIDRGADLRRWAALIRAWQERQRGQGREGDTLIFLNNHYAGSSPRTANDLAALLDLPPFTFAGINPASVRTHDSALRLPGF